MLYESTGEVRAPKTNEYYLNSFSTPDREKLVVKSSGNYKEPWPEVIMRVVNKGQREAIPIEDIGEMIALSHASKRRIYDDFDEEI